MSSKLTPPSSEEKRGPFAPSASRLEGARAMAYAAWIGGYEALAFEALVDAPPHVARPALCDLALRAPQEGIRVQALRALGKDDDPIAGEIIEAALDCASGPVRLEALRRLKSRGEGSAARLAQLIATDPAPLIRRQALEPLAGLGALEALWGALEDPVWRVRRAAARVLERHALAQPEPAAWVRSAAPTLASAKGRRALRFLLDRLEGGEMPAPAPEPPWTEAPFWSDDPAVMVSNVKHLDEAAQIEHLDALLDLIGFQDGYPLNDQLMAMRALIARRLERSGTLAQWRRALRWLDAPRTPFAVAWARRVAERASPEVARAVLAAREGRAPLIWALESRAAEIQWGAWSTHPDAAVRRAAFEACSARLGDEEIEAAAQDEALSAAALEAWAKRRRLAPPRLPPAARPLLAAHPRWATRVEEAEWEAWIEGAPGLRRRAASALARSGLHPHLTARLQAHPDHRTRAAAMTEAYARRLQAAPESEPSWRVLAAAMEALEAPLSSVAPEAAAGLEPKIVERRWQTDSYFSLAPLAPAYRRPYGALDAAPTPRAPRSLAGRPVSPLAVSGRHALSEAGYEHALSMGVNAFFWEPEYTHLTRWAQALPDPVRREIFWLGGTFAHEPQHVLRDLEWMRRTLKIDEVGAFILFWVRDEARLGDEIVEALLEAQAEGHVRSFGFSTHDRRLALSGLLAGWPLVMVRHSAGHPSAEDEIFPTAHRLGAQVITFSNLCYGLMLDPRGGEPPPYDAADCYRYALSQPGVTLSLTAPSTLKALKQNLAVLDQPTLDPTKLAVMRRWAAPLREDTRRLLRQIRAQ